VAREAEVLDPFDDVRFLVEKIADDDDDAFALDPACHLVEDVGERGFALRLEAGQGLEDPEELVPGVRAGEVLADILIEQGERDGVALVEDEIGQARGDALRVFELRNLGAGSLVEHGLAPIDEDVGDVVGLLLVLFDVVALGAP
jgi:hypothetical protein